MQNNRPYLFRTARTSRSGFTLVELLVVIGIIAILAGVALGPITRGIKQAQESGTVQVAHQIGVLEFAYSNDYNQVYPTATSGMLLANLLLANGYATTPSVFYVASTPGSQKYTGTTTPPAFTADAQESWDFMTAGTLGGLTSSASDGTPLCQLTGASTLTVGAAQGPIALPLNTTETAFGADGIAVYYKGNNAKWLKAVAASSTTANVPTTSSSPWIDSSFNDPNGASYTLITP